MKVVRDSINEGSGRYSFKRVVDSILTPIANDLGVELVSGKRNVKTNVHGTVSRTQEYVIGDITIALKEVKVPGMGADNAELWVLDKKDPTKGVRFNGMNGYSGLIDFIAKELGASGGAPVTSEDGWDDDKLEQFLKDLKADNLKLSDNEAYDIARGILAEDEGLKEYLEEAKGIADPLGWLADRI